MNDLMNSVISDSEREEFKRKFALENPNGPPLSVNIGGYGNLLFKDDAAYQQFQADPQSMTFSQVGGGRKLVEPKTSDAEREEYKRRFAMENPNGPPLSVNVGGYGNLLFKDNSAFEQFQQNPQNMTFSQADGDRRFVEPRVINSPSQSPSMQPTPRLPQMPNPAMQMMPNSDMQNNFMLNDQSIMNGAKGMPQGLLKLIRGL